MHKLFKIFIRILTWFTLVLFIVLLVVAIVSQTAWFRGQLKQQAIKAANQNLNATLHIGKIQGNLVTFLSLSDVMLTQEQDTLAIIPQLDIRFRPLELLDNIIAFNVIRIDSAQFTLVQRPDSTWNVSTIVPEQEQPQPEPQKQKSGPEWQLYFNRVALNEWTMVFDSALDPFWLPNKIDKLNAILSVAIEKEINIDLESLSLQTLHPNLEIDRLGFNMQIHQDTLDLNQLVLQLAKSRIMGNVLVPLKNPQTLSFALHSPRVDFSEIQPILPSLPPRVLDSVSVKMQYQEPAHQTDIFIRSDDQLITSQGKLISFTQFEGQVNFQNLDLEPWVGDTLWQTDLNGRLKADVRFTDITSPGSLQINLSESSWQDEQLQRFSLDLSTNGQKATLDFYFDSEFGSANLTGRIDYSTQVKTFESRGRLLGLNIQNLTQNEQLDSDVSLTVQADGSFTDLASLETNLYVTSEEMELADFSIDTLAIAGTWRNRELFLRTAKIRTPFAGLDLQGQISQNLQHDIELVLTITDTLYFPQWIDLETLVLPMQLSGNLQGDSISTNADVNARIQRAVYNDMTADSLYISFKGAIDTTGVRGNSHIWGNRIDLGSIDVDSLSLDSQLDSTIENRLSATINSKEKLYSHFIVKQGPPVSIRIDSLYNEWRKTTWHTMGREATILIDPPEYKIQNLYLASKEGKIELESTLNLQGAVEADLSITDVNLDPYSFLLEQYSPLKGSFNSEFQLRGHADKPIFTGQTRIDSLEMGKTRMGHWKLNTEYREDLLRSSLTWDRGEQQLEFRARIPITLNFTQPDTTLLQPGGTVQIQTEEFNLSVLQFFAPQITSLQGYMQADLQIKDPLQSPKPSGSLKIDEASLRIPSMGIAYDNITLAGQSEPNRFTLQNLHLETGSGALNANGYIDYQSNLPSPNISLNIETDNFLVMQSPRLQARIHGQVSVDGTLNQPRYDGQLTVLRSRVDISKFATDAPQSPGDKPLLVQLQPQKETQKPVQETTPAFTNTIENLQGKIQVRIPRNTWIKSPDMSIEIRGNLEILKNNAYFEIFGSIETIRGFYEIYGKRFRINEGTIQFQGGEKFNPLLDFTAIYTFRSPEGIKKELTIQISGTLQEPDISFLLEDQPIEERDAISYLILGRAYDQLTLSQRSEMETSQGPLGGGMLTNIIAGGFAGTLTSALQQQLNLDIIEFKGDQNWRQASVVIGKYITNDLFLSYERTLAFSRSTEVAPEKVSMEYEVTPWLFLQATKGDEKSTGFDIIWKYRGYNND